MAINNEFEVRTARAHQRTRIEVVLHLHTVIYPIARGCQNLESLSFLYRFPRVVVVIVVANVLVTIGPIYFTSKLLHRYDENFKTAAAATEQTPDARWWSVNMRRERRAPNALLHRKWGMFCCFTSSSIQQQAATTELAIEAYGIVWLSVLTSVTGSIRLIQSITRSLPTSAVSSNVDL